MNFVRAKVGKHSERGRNVQENIKQNKNDINCSYSENTCKNIVFLVIQKEIILD